MKMLHLSPNIENLINERLESDIYESVNEVVYEALKLLKERDERLARIRAEVQSGFSKQQGNEPELN
jgi:putative addiction module CopG family antidote